MAQTFKLLPAWEKLFGKLAKTVTLRIYLFEDGSRLFMAPDGVWYDKFSEEQDEFVFVAFGRNEKELFEIATKVLLSRDKNPGIIRAS